MVDFVKGKATHPVGAGLVFPRGFNEKVVTPSGEVWLKKGVVETDKSKFDVNLWRRPAISTLIYSDTPYDTTTSALRVFTQIAESGVLLVTNTEVTDPTGNLYRSAVDIEDRLLVSIDSNGNKICRNFGIVGGVLYGDYTFTHVRIK